MIPYRVLKLLLTIALLHYCGGGNMDANYAKSSRQSFKISCWLCEVPMCTEGLTSQWTQWISCSSPCGKKRYQSRTRLVHHPPSCPNGSCTHVLSKEWRPCNRFCHNGGTPNRWFCSCPLTYIGDCCETVQFESLGCFKNSRPRSLPLLIENLRKNINRNDMTKTVRACAEIVQRSGLAIFVIQFYGECWSGVDAWKTYDKYGPSKDCWSGVGREGSYFVYKVTK